jgi:hypothetical protein
MRKTIVRKNLQLVPRDLEILRELSDDDALNYSSYSTAHEVRVRLMNIPLDNDALNKGHVMTIKKLHRVPQLFNGSATYEDILSQLLIVGITPSRVLTENNTVDYYICKNVPQLHPTLLPKVRHFKNGRLS